MSTTSYDASVRSRADNGAVQAQRAIRDERSIGDLFKELQDDGSRLVRQEIELAKAEVRESLKVYAKSAVSMAIGGALLLGALFFVLWTINMALTALLENAVGIGNAVWPSPLILAVVTGLIGYSMLKGGVNRMSDESIVPRRTTETLKEEKQWLKNRHA